MNTQHNDDAKKRLDGRQQSIVIVSALTAIGDLERLSIQLGVGLDAGLTINQVKEILVQLYAYCGFPRSLNGISTLMRVLEDRRLKGITDQQGEEAEIGEVIDKYEQGRRVIETLTQTPQPRPAPGFGEFAPRIDTFLKEHLFADIFASTVLTFLQRELVTISALSAMTGVEPQLQAHIQMGINTGLNKNHLLHLFDLIEQCISKEQADQSRAVFSRIAFAE